MPIRSSALTEILSRVTFLARRRRRPVPAEEWFSSVEQVVREQVRAEVDPLVRSLLPPSGSILSGVVYDPARGSLVLTFDKSRRLVLAVDDHVAAAELEAAQQLGGLKLMLARCGVGLVAVEGLWEGRRYFLTGVPSVR